jgi:hypothetical protein
LQPDAAHTRTASAWVVSCRRRGWRSEELGEVAADDVLVADVELREERLVHEAPDPRVGRGVGAVGSPGHGGELVERVFDVGGHLAER